VMDQNGNWFSNFAQVPKELHDKIFATMFPGEESENNHLRKCVRIHPHMQDTSGFFLAVFEKTSQTHAEIKQEVDLPRHTLPFSPMTSPKHGSRISELTETLNKMYEIRENFPWSNAFGRKEELSNQKIKSILLFSESLKELFTKVGDSSNFSLKIINGGVVVFKRNNKKYDVHTNLGLTAESVGSMIRFLGKKRVFTLPRAEFIKLVKDQKIPFEKISNEDSKKRLQKLFVGYVAVKLEHNENSGNMQRDSDIIVVCRNCGGWLSLCASSSQMWTLNFLLGV